MRLPSSHPCDSQGAPVCWLCSKAGGRAAPPCPQTPTSAPEHSAAPSAAEGCPLGISCHGVDGPSSPAHVEDPGTPAPAASAVTSPGCGTRFFPHAGGVLHLPGATGSCWGTVVPQGKAAIPGAARLLQGSLPYTGNFLYSSQKAVVPIAGAGQGGSSKQGTHKARFENLFSPMVPQKP